MKKQNEIKYTDDAERISDEILQKFKKTNDIIALHIRITEALRTLQSAHDKRSKEMNRESIIKEFEAATGEKRPPVISTVAYHSNAHDRWVEAFTNWLLSKVIAQGDEIERFKEQVKALNEEIIYDLKEACFERAEERDIIQSAHDKLKEENDQFKAIKKKTRGVNVKGMTAKQLASYHAFQSALIVTKAMNKSLQEKYDKLKEEKRATLCIYCGETIEHPQDPEKIAEIHAIMKEHDLNCKKHPVNIKYDKLKQVINDAQIVWVARDGAEVPQTPKQVTIFENKPQRWAHGTEEWQPVDGNVFFEIKPDLGMYLFPELKWEDEPLEIRLLTPEEMED